MVRFSILLFAVASVLFSSQAVAESLCNSNCTFVLKSESTGTYTIVNPDRANQPLSPFSTFKVPNSLIALDTGIVSGTETKLTYDQDSYPIESWWPKTWHKEPLSLRDAFKYSALPIYQTIATKIGPDQMADYVTRFEYGNNDTSSGIDNFWLNESLKISAIEQVNFLQRLYNAKLPVSDEALSQLKSIMLVEQTNDYKLYAKTGAGGIGEKQYLGWYVGFVENEDGVFYFALNLEAPTFKQATKNRIDTVKEQLALAGVIKEKQYELRNTRVVTIDSKVLGRKYDLYIKVPRGYDHPDNSAKRYPALYLNDGPYTFKVAIGVTNPRPLDKAIVVGISFAKGESGMASRVRDLTPEHDASWQDYETGGGASYLEFIENEVFTYIESNYRINTDQRILAGQSLGGSFGVWVLLTKPELFSSYILTSPSLWYKDHLIYQTESTYHEANKQLSANVYMATGGLETRANGMRNEMAQDQLKFVDHLRSRQYQGLNLAAEITEGTDHFSTFPVGLSKGLMFIYDQFEK